ncbi:MAG: hypothetical protein Q8P32_01960 [Candidatus Komeilibacteria bacterium]|nr:hypothetical protein [Candidatus Komeilibacteria bacterium]
MHLYILIIIATIFLAGCSKVASYKFWEVQAEERGFIKSEKSIAVDSLKHHLPKYFTDERFGPIAREVFDKLPEYSLIISKAYSQANSGYRVDVIYQTHSFKGATKEQIEWVNQAQLLVVKILQGLKPELVSWEGVEEGLTDYSSLAYSRTGLSDIGISALRSLGIPTDQIEVSNDTGIEAKTIYLKDSPGLNMGFEDPSLHSLHSQALLAVSQDRSLINLCISIQCVRGELAFAKTFTMLKTKNLHHGVIVIGNGHRELDLITLNAGVRSSLYDASNGLNLQPLIQR